MADGWHTLDAEAGYEVRKVDDVWQVLDAHGGITELTDEEFEQLRSEGENPGELN